METRQKWLFWGKITSLRENFHNSVEVQYRTPMMFLLEFHVDLSRYKEK